jgi:polynucleotide 5'-hydroxyl-kinase GRC3/NOL9
MDQASDKADLPPAWSKAIINACAGRRTVVLGATDMGKSTFIRAFLAECGQAAMLIDLDPGQKMIGPPGTVTLGRLEPPMVERFIFIGSTSSSSISKIARAAADFARIADRSGPFIANTSGFVTGLGARLQAATVAALEPDLIVEIGSVPNAPPLVTAQAADIPLLRLERSPAARRKSPAARARLRQQALEDALRGARMLTLPSLHFDPAPPAALMGAARPICALADGAGIDRSYGILEAVEEGWVRIRAVAPERPIERIRLGRMWAEPEEGGWRLMEKLSPSWVSPAGA